MASKNDSEINACTFQWKIENISHSWLKKGEILMSPAFIADGLEGTKWSLLLYPKGIENESVISAFIYREKDCNGPDVIEVNCALALLDKDGSALKETIWKQGVKKSTVFGSIGESRSKVFATNREAFLPNDTLTVQCTIWKKDETIVKSGHISARTVLKINRRTFVWKIEKFTSLKPGVRNKFKDDLIEFHLVFDELLDSVKKLDVDIITFQKTITFFSFKISVINSEGEKEECAKQEYFPGDLKVGVICMPLFTKMLIENKARYLRNDVLLLDCEFVSSNGDILDELWTCGIISPKVAKVNAEKEKHQPTQFLAKDMKSMYNDGIFSDTELRTSTQTFQAHKNILSARSPVFRRMFSNDMKEKNSGHVDITDLEDDTVHRMLLYVYTDTLENVDLEDACKLYSAADKYEILSL